jgi:RNA polymerase sigma-32 factor
VTNRDDPHLRAYVAAARVVPALDREAEVELVRAWRRRGDRSAADRLVRAHLRHVVVLALKYRRYAVPLPELIAEGNFGLVHALRKFDERRGTRFVTYAVYWVRAYMLSYIIRSWSLVGVGSGALRSKMFFKLRRERVRVLSLVGEGERADELLAERMNLSREQLSGMLTRLEARDVSLDTRVFDDALTTLVDTLVAPDQAQDETVAQQRRQARLRATVRTAVGGLDERERYIVEKRLMAEGDDELSLAEIGRRLGVSRERARQLEARAKRKLRARITELSGTPSSGLEALSAA